VTDGDWLVGDELVPGRYAALEVPDHVFCSWSSGRTFTGDEGDALDGGSIGGGPDDAEPTIDLHPGERFSTGDCGTWTRQP
jgi:hypothetical protein